MTELLNTLLILGAAQGLFLAIILASKRVNSTANRLLAISMVAFALFILEGVYYERGLQESFPHLIGVSVPLVYLFGPLLYLYTEVVSHGGHTFHRRWLLHFIPSLLVTLWLTPFFLQGGAEKLAFLHRMDAEGPPTYVAIIQVLQYVHGFIYVGLTFYALRRHGERLRANYSAIEELNLAWLRNLLIGTAGVWAVATGLEVVDTMGLPMAPWTHRLTPLALSVLVYAIGYMALQQPEIIQPRVPTPLTPQIDPATGEYEKSGLSSAEAESHMTRLRAVVTEKQLHLRSGLTLQELADESGISVHNVSEVINTVAKQNFYDFVNSYRVEEAKRRLRDPKYKHLTILAVATDSGFNSKSVFNAYFKEQTGQTPSQYRAG